MFSGMFYGGGLAVVRQAAEWHLRLLADGAEVTMAGYRLSADS